MKWYTSQGTFGLFLYHQALQCKSCWKKIIISLICNCKRQLQILTTQPWVPTTIGKKGTCHTDIIYMVDTTVGRGEQSRNSYYAWRQNGITSKAWETREERWLHRLTNASSNHALTQVNKQTQPNTRECRPLMDALVKACYKTPLGTGECRHTCRRMHRHVCITILQTLKGTQTVFVVNSVRLH